jgi:hypothetical protein
LVRRGANRGSFSRYFTLSITSPRLAHAAGTRTGAATDGSMHSVPLWKQRRSVVLRELTLNELRLIRV